MPWIINDVDKFKKGLDDKQKEKWISIANSVLSKCIKGGGEELDCEVKAIRTANARIDDKDESELSNYVMSKNIIYNKQERINIILANVNIDEDYQLAFPIGLFNTSKYGEVIITKTFADRTVNNWKKLKKYERNIWMDTQHDFGAANAWADDVISDDNGIKIKWDFTPKGKKLIEDKEYKYYSAAIMMDTDIETGKGMYPVLEAVSLTNSPVMYTMPGAHLDNFEKYNCECIKCGYKIKSDVHCDKIKCPECGGTMRRQERPGPGKNTHSDVNINNMEVKMIIEEILKQLKEFDLKDDDKKKLINQLSEIELSDDQKKEVVKKFGIEIPKKEKENPENVKELENTRNENETLKDVNKTLSDRLSKIEKSNHEKAKNELFEKAIPEKIKPADREKWEQRYNKNPDSITEIINDLPKLYDFSEIGDASNKPVIMNENDNEYAKAFGITEEDYKNYLDSNKLVKKEDKKEDK